MDGFLGEIRMFGFSFPPRNWAAANGALLPVSQNQALYSVFGNAYGGVSGQSFGVPDLRGMAPMGFDPANPSEMGTRTGYPRYLFTAENVPAHNHGFRIGVGDFHDMMPQPDGEAVPSRFRKAADGTVVTAYADPDANLGAMPNVVQPSQGAAGGAFYDAMNPYLVLNMCICTQGQVPVRPSP